MLGVDIREVTWELSGRLGVVARGEKVSDMLVNVASRQEVALSRVDRYRRQGERLKSLDYLG